MSAVVHPPAIVLTLAEGILRPRALHVIQEYRARPLPKRRIRVSLQKHTTKSSCLMDPHNNCF